MRGLKCLKPCCVCEVPKEELFDTSKTFKLRSATESKELYEKGKTVKTKKDREAILKPAGLRPVEVSS